MKFLCLLTLVIHGHEQLGLVRIKLDQDHFNLNFILTYNMYTVEQLHRSDICSLIFIKTTAQIKILAVL